MQYNYFIIKRLLKSDMTFFLACSDMMARFTSVAVLLLVACCLMGELLFIYYKYELILNLFIEGRLRSKLSQLILIALDHSFQMESISCFERGLRGERSQTCPYILSAKQGSIWNHVYNVVGMTRSGIEPTTSCLRGERSNH